MSAALTRAASRRVRWLTSLGESRTRLVDKAVLLCPGSNRFRTALLEVSGAGDGIRTRDLLFTNSSPACKLVLVAAVFGFWHRARCEASQISRSTSHTTADIVPCRFEEPRRNRSAPERATIWTASYRK